MEYDLVIRNGRIVDGTGAASFTGDVAVQAGRIAAVGRVAGRGRRELDATGRLVTPGWVDVHTHLDGQATWDSLLMPASNHGVTTVVMGNCGVGFAPCQPTAEAHDQLIAVMEDVEDIPGTALHEGISWTWESFPQYLDTLERMPHAIDVAAQVAHCAVRTYVMGERGARNEPATADDIARMAAIVREGLEAGAIGFSTSRTQLHRTRDGEVMPGTYADEAELLGIGKVLGETGKGVYQLVSDWDEWEKEMDWMKRLSISTGRPVGFVLFYRADEEWERVQRQLEYVRQANAEGAQLVPHVGARPVTILMAFDGTAHPFMFHQAFQPLAGLPAAERLAKLRDPAVRAAMLAETPPSLGHPIADRLAVEFDNMYPLEDDPSYEPRAEDSIAAQAARRGLSPAALAYDRLLENDGKRMFYFPVFGYQTHDLSRQLSMLQDPNAILSLSDAGAHCGVLCDASMPTFMLSYFVRDRERGERLALERAVHLQTQKTARSVGLLDRGALAPGLKADINIIDFDRLRLHTPEVVYDLPAGGRRVFQTAEGYVATIVSGEPVYENGTPTGAMPGRLVRGSQPEPVSNAA
ncbi:MAG: amidohydrolase family protein [Gammaproteobacteria bacterium]|nr:amidohydrolase family protein [Gammaproteobacteria bacterium]